MITPLSAEKIKQKFKVEFRQTAKVSQVGGAAVFVAFLREARIKERLQAEFGEPCARAILQVALGIFAGADDMEGVALICKDKLFKDYLKSPVSATQITRTLATMSPAQVQKLHEFTLSLGLLDITDSAFKGFLMALDFDATPLEMSGHQEGVEFGYVERDKIARCYQYLFVRNDYLKSLLYGTIRGGAAHSQNDFCGYLNMILPMFSGAWTLMVRADSGFFNEEAFDICCENKAYFLIKAPMSESRTMQALSDHLVWQTAESEKGVEHACRETRTKKGFVWREVFKRSRIFDKQRELLPGYRYDCIATNELKKPPSDVYKTYNGRARIENTNCEMKQDYHLGKIATQHFHVNDVITQSTIMLYQLVKHFQRHCLDKADQNLRLCTLRTKLFNVPAITISSARREWLRVHNVFKDFLAYSRIFARIIALRTVLVRVGVADTG